MFNSEDCDGDVRNLAGLSVFRYLSSHNFMYLYMYTESRISISSSHENIVFKMECNQFKYRNKNKWKE